MSKVTAIAYAPGNQALHVTLDCGHLLLVPSGNPLLEKGAIMPCEPCIRHERVITSVDLSSMSPHLVDITLECGHKIHKVMLRRGMTLSAAREFIATPCRCHQCYPDTPDKLLQLG